MASSCSDIRSTVTCTVTGAGGSASVQLNTDDGATSKASLVGYSVTFTAHTKSPRIVAEIEDKTGQSLGTLSAGGSGTFTGSLASPDGQLDVSCMP